MIATGPSAEDSATRAGEVPLALDAIHEGPLVRLLGRLAHHAVESDRIVADEDPPRIAAHAVEDDRRRLRRGQRGVVAEADAEDLLPLGALVVEKAGAAADAGVVERSGSAAGRAADRPLQPVGRRTHFSTESSRTGTAGQFLVPPVTKRTHQSALLSKKLVNMLLRTRIGRRAEYPCEPSSLDRDGGGLLQPHSPRRAC